MEVYIEGPILTNQNWKYRAASWKEATLYLIDILTNTLIGKLNEIHLENGPMNNEVVWNCDIYH